MEERHLCSGQEVRKIFGEAFVDKTNVVPGMVSKLYPITEKKIVPFHVFLTILSKKNFL